MGAPRPVVAGKVRVPRSHNLRGYDPGPDFAREGAPSGQSIPSRRTTRIACFMRRRLTRRIGSMILARGLAALVHT